MPYEPNFKGTVSSGPRIATPEPDEPKEGYNTNEVIIVSAVALGLGVAFIWYMHNKSLIHTGPVLSLEPGYGQDIAIATNIAHGLLVTPK